MQLVLMKQTDYTILKELYQNQDVMTMITGYPLNDDEIEKKWNNIISWKKPYGYYKVIVDQICIGIGCLKPHCDGVEIGYMLFPRYWHQGYGSLICENLIMIVQTMPVKKIVAYIDPRNKASKRILEKHGLKSVYIKEDTEILERVLGMKITGYTGMYGIVANPIKHSFSPMMHNTSFQELGIDDVYLAFEVEEHKLQDFITSVHTLKIKGFNVSMPYKMKIMDYLDELTPEAKLCQAVNTVKNENGKLIGHISDGKGFYFACLEKKWDIKNQKIVVLGAGGAANAIIVELAMQGVREIIVYNRSDKPFIKQLNDQLDCSIVLKTMDLLALKEDLKDTYLLIQTTSVGMKPHDNECLIPDESYLPSSLKVADIIYNPKETKLLSFAKKKGLDYMNGESMIVYQGAVSFEFWTGQKMPVDKVKKELGME